MKQWVLLSLAVLPLVATGVLVFAPQRVTPTAPQPAPTQPAPPAQAGASPGITAMSPSLASAVAVPQVSSNQGPVPAATTTAASQGSSNTSVTTKEFPDEALHLAMVTGRRIIPHQDAITKVPFTSIGRFYNEGQPKLTVGTGVLIKTDVVLTAAHVLETLQARERQGEGRCMFVAAGLEPSEVGDAEADAAWKKKIVSGDIAVCHLDKPFYVSYLHLHPTDFDPADENNVFGESVAAYGYDLDIWAACGYCDNPPLVARTGTFMNMKEKLDRAGANEWLKNLREQVEIINNAANVFLLQGARKGFANDHEGYKNRIDEIESSRDSVNALVAGATLLLGATLYLYHDVNANFGWTSDAVGAMGSDGGPVMIQHQVLGVMGYPDGGKMGSVGTQLGYLVGTRLTGPVADMVEGFAGLPPQ